VAGGAYAFAARRGGTLTAVGFGGLAAGASFLMGGAPLVVALVGAVAGAFAGIAGPRLSVLATPLVALATWGAVGLGLITPGAAPAALTGVGTALAAQPALAAIPVGLGLAAWKPTRPIVNVAARTAVSLPTLFATGVHFFKGWSKPGFWKSMFLVSVLTTGLSNFGDGLGRNMQENGWSWTGRVMAGSGNFLRDNLGRAPTITGWGSLTNALGWTNFDFPTAEERATERFQAERQAAAERANAADAVRRSTGGTTPPAQAAPAAAPRVQPPAQPPAQPVKPKKGFAPPPSVQSAPAAAPQTQPPAQPPAQPVKPKKGFAPPSPQTGSTISVPSGGPNADPMYVREGTGGLRRPFRAAEEPAGQGPDLGTIGQLAYSAHRREEDRGNGALGDSGDDLGPDAV
jgi:hypothetical protein